MSRVVTYTPNPAIDSWAACEEIHATEKTRVGQVRYDPGGGGINVARVLQRLGTPAHPVYLAGGVTRPLFEGLLQRVGLEGTCVPIEGDTRISQVILERRTGREFRFVAEGPSVSDAERRAALDALASCGGAWLAASGSLPPGLPDHHYAEVARAARARGARFALDCSGRALAAAVAEGGIDLLKASRHELEELTGTALADTRAVAEAAKRLSATGRTARVVVSLGPDGAVLADDGGITTVSAPAVEVHSTVGAGDSFLGGFLHGLVSGLSSAAALELAVAVGSAACLHAGTQLARREDVERLRGRPLPHPEAGAARG